MIGIVEQYIGYKFMEPSWFFLTLLLPLFFLLFYKLNQSNIFGFRYTNTVENQQEITSFCINPKNILACFKDSFVSFIYCALGQTH